MTKRSLTLVLPGVGPYLSQLQPQSVQPAILSKMLCKGKHEARSLSLTAFLFDCFSALPASGHDLPAAQLRSPDSVAICADPCYLHPDRDRLLLFSEDLALSEQEASSFIDAIQPLLDEFDAKLIMHSPNQWLLHLSRLPEVEFHALPGLQGKAITHALPQGPAYKDWVRLGNEIQMLLATLPFNEERQARGALPVNAVWFWGKGSLVLEKQRWQYSSGNNALLAMLSRAVQCSYTAEVDDIKSWLSQDHGSYLYVTDNLSLLNTQQMTWLEQQLLTPIWHLLKTGNLGKLTLIIPDWGYCYLSSWSCWKPW